ncbi:MAG: glycosyltransferase [Pyrinomonadaceae bacterium]|nr:glycosyltransferase [Pyrinomonadaceae bacterium]
MKKRVLQFIGSFHQGGTERQAVSLARLLHSDATYDVHVATLNKEGILLDEIEVLGLPVIEEFKLTSFYNANFVSQVRLCSSYLRANKIDVVHTHDFYTNVFGMAAATLAGVPVRIASKRETGAMRTPGQDFVEKLAFGRADAIVVNAAAVREHLIERSVSKAKIHVIYNGLDLSRFLTKVADKASIAARFGLPADNDAKFITLVANLRHSVKNIPMLLRAAKTVVRTMPNAHFVIAGEGELGPRLRAISSELGIEENVHFIGGCADVPALLAASDICVLTSTAEGFSNSILEYMAAGKPVVATKVGGAAEAIADGASGYLISSDDDVALAARLKGLLSDAEKAESFGLEGRKIVTEKFSQDSRLAETLKLYGDLLDGRKS